MLERPQLLQHANGQVHLISRPCRGRGGESLVNIRDDLEKNETSHTFGLLLSSMACFSALSGSNAAALYPVFRREPSR